MRPPSWRPCGAASMLALLLLLGCGDQRFAPPDRSQRVASADSAFDPTMFDSIRWDEGDEARAFAGNETYARKCRGCHGYLGEGDTEYNRERGFAPPSLVRPDWPAGDSIPLMRRRIFTGHPAGMPTFGIGNLTAREVDATAYYIVRDLRPEVLGTRR